MVISTCNSLETVYLDQGGVDNLEAWLQGRFPNQKLTFSKKEYEFFLSTKDALGAIFMYMLLDNFQIKARFKKVPEDATNRIP